MRAAMLGLALAGLAAAPLAAQDSQFSIRGLGTPGRAESVAARGTGGAFAAFDGFSALADAALANVTRFGAEAAAYTSRRTVDFTDGTSASLRNTRFPLLTMAGPVLPGLVLGGGFDTYLNRSYSVTVPDTVLVRGVMEPVTDVLGRDGAVTDLRIAAAYRASAAIAVGVGVHVLTGSAQLTADRFFADSAVYPNAVQRSRESYDGFGVSASVLASFRNVDVTAFARSDGHVTTRVLGRPPTATDLPTTFGAAARVTLTPRLRAAASVQHSAWSVAGPGAYNTLDWSAGIDYRSGSFPLRLGVRGGRLPFSATGSAPQEFGIAAGSGFVVSEGRGAVDFTVERLTRSSGGVHETALTFLLGFSVRP